MRGQCHEQGRQINTTIILILYSTKSFCLLFSASYDLIDVYMKLKILILMIQNWLILLQEEKKEKKKKTNTRVSTILFYFWIYNLKKRTLLVV